MNQELFKKVHDVISATPRDLEMSTWEEPENQCGTTRCVAGWAIFLTTGKPLYTPESNYMRMDPSVLELAGPTVTRDQDVKFEQIGADLLDLQFNECWLFYADSGIAREFVRLASEGKFDEARALRGANADDYEDV